MTKNNVSSPKTCRCVCCINIFIVRVFHVLYWLEQSEKNIIFILYYFIYLFILFIYFIYHHDSTRTPIPSVGGSCKVWEDALIDSECLRVDSTDFPSCSPTCPFNEDPVWKESFDKLINYIVIFICTYLLYRFEP
jgi:hypothetical protein